MILKLIFAATWTLALLGCAPAQAEGEESLSAFRSVVAQRVQEMKPEAKLTPVDDWTLKVIYPDGRSELLSVQTAYVHYSRDPTRRDEIIGRLISTVGADGEGPLAEPNRLVVIIRPASVLNGLGPDRQGASKIISKPFVGDLVQILAADSANSIRYAGREDLQALKLGDDAAWSLALSNTSARMGKIESIPLEGAEDLLAVGSQSGLGPSALLHPSSCGPAANGSEGQLVLVLDREYFATPADKKPRSQQIFWTLAKHEANSPEAFSRTPITCQGGRWVIASAPEG